VACCELLVAGRPRTDVRRVTGTALDRVTRTGPPRPRDVPRATINPLPLPALTLPEAARTIRRATKDLRKRTNAAI
jgi:hypothetical protein